MRGPRWASSSSPQSILLDLVAAVLVTAFLLLVTAHIPVDTDERELDALGWAALVLAGSSIGFCRRVPGLAVALSTAALAVYVMREYVGGPVYLTVWVALFALAWHARRRVAFAAAAMVAVLLAAASALAGHAAIPLQLVFLGWSAAAVFLGDSLRNRRSYLAQLEERARVLELSREQEAKRRVAEDRLRIAQDLHDSVAHAMATINVQAGAAAHVVDRRPDAAREALSAIREASGEVLDELAALLGVLRSGSDLTGVDQDGRHPDTTAADGQPALGSVPRLVHTTRRAGLPVSLEMTGPLDAVPQDVGAAAYRIVQESLTNVLRHSGQVPTSVHLDCSADGALTVRVDNEPSTLDPPGDPDASAGLGIRGMQERATATGGRVRTGSRGDGGFSVCATWPGVASPVTSANGRGDR